MTTLDDVARMTDVDRATKVVAEAANAMKRLDRECDSTFKTWVEAQVVADEVGLVVDLKVSSGLSAHLSEYKQRSQKASAKEHVNEIFDHSRKVAPNDSEH